MNDTVIASLFSFLISDGFFFFFDFGTYFSRRPLISRKRKQSKSQQKNKDEQIEKSIFLCNINACKN